MPTIPAPRRASLISSSLNGFTTAVTRWITVSPSTRRAWAGERWRRQMWTSPPLCDRSDWFLVRWDGCSSWHIGAAQRPPGAQQGRVAHALAKLHVVGGCAVLVDVEALELAVLLESEVPRTLEGPDGEHHQ